MGRFLAIVSLLGLWPARFIIQRVMRLVDGKQKAKRILIIQFAGLGDTLMLTPALAALKKSYPEAKVDFITLHEYVRDAFQRHPLIDEIKVLPAYSGEWIIAQFANLSTAKLVIATVRYYPFLILHLAFRRYVAGVNFGLADFDQGLGNALLFCLDIPVRIGVRGRYDQLLTQRADVNYRQTDRVGTYLGLLQSHGIPTPAGAYEYPVSKADLATVDQVLARQRIDSTRPLVVIHPGGKLHINSRRWPAQNFARVGAFLSSEGFEVVLTGDGEDSNVCEEIVRNFASNATSLAGDLNFSETAALLSRAELVITNDTSTLHLAEAVRVSRIISIFGPTDASLLAPRNERHIVFKSNLPCAPCMGGIIDADSERCWRDVKEECLWQTTPEQVIDVLRALYSKPFVRVAGA